MLCGQLTYTHYFLSGRLHWIHGEQSVTQRNTHRDAHTADAYMGTHTYTYTNIHADAHTDADPDGQTYPHRRMHTQMHTGTHTYTYTNTQLQMHTGSTHTHTQIYTQMQIHMNTHAHNCEMSISKGFYSLNMLCQILNELANWYYKMKNFKQLINISPFTHSWDLVMSYIKYIVEWSLHWKWEQ